MYEQVERGKLVHDTIRHGRFTIIAKQRNYSLYKADKEDALIVLPVFSYSVQDTMTALLESGEIDHSESGRKNQFQPI